MSDEPTRLACVLLVDERGWLLLQERDEQAPRAPGRWGMPGGHVEEGESFVDAAYRELTEETGIVLEAGHLYLWRDEELRYSEEPGAFRCHVYAGRVDGITDADVVVGEGRQIVFVDPARVDDLPLAESTEHFVPAFLQSAAYARLRGFAPTTPDDAR